MFREVDRVLTGATAYLEHRASARECVRKDPQDRTFVALTGFGC
jgi:hypothetical protein